MSLSPTRRDWRLMLNDVVRGIAAWHVWVLLGFSDIRQRYKRSKFGQFWITLSMGIFVAGIGIVYAFLFNQPVREYLPFLAVNMVVWTLIAGIVNEATLAFVQASVYLRQEAMPKTVFILRILVRNLIAFAHNLIIIPIVWACFLVVPSPTMLLAIPGLVLMMVAAFLSAMIIGILSTRFRDLPQIIQNLLQIAFFMTPVMWRVDQMGAAAWYIVGFNPFAVFLRIVAEPLHGRIPGLATYASAFVVIAVLMLIAAPLFARFRARIVYWL
ncbi:O-antigen export system permease protein RfbD [Hyphomicrobiales bacterium]|nr:O-antigen export system permease protein RfbD [Hyphomicrobiales bacterium]CAH1680708.1 O-antigen export system permease protein RfbD [Hyphomicrobiales bacterium]